MSIMLKKNINNNISENRWEQSNEANCDKFRQPVWTESDPLSRRGGNYAFMGLFVVSILQFYSTVPSFFSSTHWLLVIGEKIKILHGATPLPTSSIRHRKLSNEAAAVNFFAICTKLFDFPNDRHPLPDQKSIKCTCRIAIIVAVRIWMEHENELCCNLSSYRQ